MRILGDIKDCQLNKPREYFEERNTFLDCRGTIIMHETVMLGFNISIFTMSHDPCDLKRCTYRTVYLGKNVFVGSNAVLYSCTIGDNSVVAVGTVVRSVNVPPNVMVAGNPAKIIAVREGAGWKYLAPPGRTLEGIGIDG